MSMCNVVPEACPYGTVCTKYQNGLDVFGKPTLSLQPYCVPYFSQPLVFPGATSATLIGTNNSMVCESGYAI